MEDRLLLAVITVTSAGDTIGAADGSVSLREAIMAANTDKPVGNAPAGSPGLNTIAFDIPGAGLHTISPTSPLPDITAPLIIDGYTQPGSSPNTNPVGQGLNAVPQIELNGANAGELTFGLIHITGGGSTVEGLIINRTDGPKIEIDNGGNNIIEGNFIGTDATGSAAFPPPVQGNLTRGFDGVFVEFSNGNIIGGPLPADRNLISANVVAAGVGIENSTGNFVEGNLIGTDVSGTHALGNGSEGVSAGSDNTVGGASAALGNVISGNPVGVSASGSCVIENNDVGTDVTGTSAVGNTNVGVLVGGNSTGTLIEQNTIAFNGTIPSSGGIPSGAGVRIVGPTSGNLITQNAIFSNNGVGLTFGANEGETPNQPTAGLGVGPNALQNYPILSSVAVNGAGTMVQGTLLSVQSSSFRLEFYANAARDEQVDPGQFSEGQTFVGAIVVTTDANGNATFTANLPALPANEPFVTATATDVTDTGSGPLNNTSEFSPVAVLGGPSFVVTNTGDTGLGTLREAIINANLTPGPHTITFAIPATDPRHFYYRNDGVAGGVTTADIATTTAASDASITGIDPDWAHSWFSILPTHALPVITNTVTIDGDSQAGAVTNSLSPLQGLNTVLKIELDGTNVSGDGLSQGIGVVSGTQQLVTNSVIQGLAINRFGGNGISLDSFGGNTIEGDFIGTDVSGTLGLPNGLNGVFLNTDSNDTIGGLTPAGYNLISANASNGIELLDSFNTTIEGDLIGTDRNLQHLLVNVADGILIVGNAYDAVGGPDPDGGVTIAFGAGDGIATQASISLASQPSAATLGASATIVPSDTDDDCEELYETAMEDQAFLNITPNPTDEGRAAVAQAWQNFEDCVMMLSPDDDPG